MNSESESAALRGATRCGAALCSPRSRWERICVSYPVHQLSLKPGGLLSDTTLTDSSLQCSVIARISFCRRIQIGIRPPEAVNAPVCVFECVCVCRRRSFLTTVEGHCYQSHIPSPSLHRPSLSLCRMSCFSDIFDLMRVIFISVLLFF